MEKEYKNMDSLRNLREMMNGQKIIFAYRGSLSDEMMLALLSLTEKKMELESSGAALRSRVFNVVVQSMQTLAMQLRPEESRQASLFMIGKDGDDYTIYSGNMVADDRVNVLRSSLQNINTMSVNELREFHRVWLQSVKDSGRGDAGLGLIDIARKTRSKLEFAFETNDNGHYFFSLCTTFRSPRTLEGSVKNISRIYHLMEMNHMAMCYRGRFSQEFNRSILKFTESKFMTEEIQDVLRRKVFNIMVEMLQNLSKHAPRFEDRTDGNDAIFMMGYDQDDYFMMAGNALFTKECKGITRRIEQINSLDKDGLKKLYKEVRLNGSFSKKSGAGIGFIDIARKSGQALEYEFIDLGEGVSYYTLLSRISLKENAFQAR